MAVDSLEYLVTYETDGDDEFSITFPVQLDTGGDAKDIKVYYRDGTGTETDITADCTISGTTVTTPSAYAETDPPSYVAITRWPELLQESSYSYGSNFPPVQITKDLDRIYYALQRLSGEINRSLVAPVTDGDVTLVLPNKAERASSLIGFDATGENIIASSGAIAATVFMATLVDDEDAEEARTTLEVYSKTETYTQAEVDALISIERKRTPIGIPTMWFSSVPDWALAFDDGSGPYAWEDYPELDNEDFKAMLTIWSNAGWMPAYNSISFYVPDLKGLFPRISGTNAIRSTVYAGGNLADYLAHQFENHQHYHSHLALSNTDDNAHSPYNRIQGSSADSTDAYRVPTTYDNTLPTSGNHGTETRPGSFSLRIIVRFE